MNFLLNNATRGTVISALHELPADNTFEVIVRQRKVTRTLEQNSKMWAMLSDISRQVEWKHFSNADGIWHLYYPTADEWKDIFTAALKKQKMVDSYDKTGVVYIGMGTRRLSIQDMADLITLMEAFGAEHDVEWADGQA